VTNTDLWEWPQMKQQSQQNGPSLLPPNKARQICSVWRARWLFCNIYGIQWHEYIYTLMFCGIYAKTYIKNAL
jgi:hypothetical protein